MKKPEPSKTYAAAMTSFSDRVIKAARAIPVGKVSTYGRIARSAGGGGQAARSVNGILVKAYDSGMIDIPFHRIVYSDGSIWVSSRYHAERMRLYKKEGIEIDKDGKIKYFHDHLYEF